MLSLKLFFLFAIVICCKAERNNYKELRIVRESVDDWWQNAIFYQIYPRSFRDSDNDGLGDINGIIEKLDHLQDMGVTATWLSPIFKSPQVDQGYDISDYRDVDPIFGTLDDLKNLINAAHDVGIKIILDFVPNHTSDQHQWFKDSVAKTEGYEDYYIWRDGKTDADGNRVPPNNWLSAFKGSAWTWNEDRQQYYYHMFTPQQPDLNYRNEKVVAEMKDVMKFWLDFGADGFRVDAVPGLFEDAEFKDEPLSNLTGFNENDFEYLVHIYTNNLDETFDMVYQWRDFLDNYTITNGGDTRVMMTEAYGDLDTVVRYYGTSDGSRLGAHFSFNFEFIQKLNDSTTGFDVTNIVMDWMDIEQDYVRYNWVLGNHDQHRAATRLGVPNIEGYNMITSMLPGIQVIYNGEEIGQEDGEVTCEEGQDPSAIKDCTTFDQVSRDFERTPFQWDDSINAGFNDGAKPWLPVSSKANETNLAAQNVPDKRSHYNLYKQMNALRKEMQSLEETLWSISQQNEYVVQIKREFHRTAYALYTNLGGEEETIYLFDNEGTATFVVVSWNSTHNIGDEIDMSDNILLGPHESYIVKLKYHLGDD